MSLPAGVIEALELSTNTFMTPDGHLHRVTYIRCIDTVTSPDDEHMSA
jgi:hypothetical protein